MKKCKLDLLILLAKKGALHEDVSVSTSQLSAELGGKSAAASQQTVSRWLLELQASAMVEKKGRNVRITAVGRQKVEEISTVLKSALEKGCSQQDGTEISGAVTSGFREGRYYMALPEYKKQLTAKLGFPPFAGTLNIRLSKQKDIESVKRIKASRCTETGGFSRDGRSFGSSKAVPVLIAGKIKGAIIFPARSHYGDDVVEVIAAVNLREKLKLKDGSEVRIAIAR
jgi:riboflavin kinase, archaea type